MLSIKYTMAADNKPLNPKHVVLESQREVSGTPGKSTKTTSVTAKITENHRIEP